MIDREHADPQSMEIIEAILRTVATEHNAYVERRRLIAELGLLRPDIAINFENAPDMRGERF